jgi:hypothetical protein
MNDPTIVAGLVVGQRLLLLEQQDPQPWSAGLQFVQGGGTNDATAHDDDIPIRGSVHA